MNEQLEFLKARVEALENENARLKENNQKATKILQELLVFLEENNN